MSYLQDIEVVYGDEPSSEPSGSIEIVTGTNGDINQGFKGKYVWLVPKYGSSPNVTGISIIIQHDHDDRYVDLAKGTEGDYRYLHFQSGGSQNVGRVALFRSETAIDRNQVSALGWHDLTSDINHGRHGSYLYIGWKWV